MMQEHRYLRGLSLPKLHGVVAAAMTVGPMRGDYYHKVVQGVAAADNAYGTDKRVWFEIVGPHNLGGKVSYISLDPGECRHAKPLSEGDVVLAAPVASHGPSLRELSTSTALGAADDEFFATDTLRLLIAQANRVVDECHPDRPEFAPMVRRLNTIIGDLGDCQLNPELFESLYSEAIPGFGMPVRDFAQAEMLLRAQLHLGFKLTGDITRINSGDLVRFLKSQDDVFVDRLVDFLARVGKMTLSGGKASAREALAQPTVFGFQHRLLHSLYCYSMAMYASEVALGVGRADRLGYKALVAEESWVCTMTGLFYGAELALGGYEAIVDEIRLTICANRADAADQIAHSYSSEIFPVLPKPVLDAFIARALIEDRSERVSEGLHRLEALWRSHIGITDHDYECSLLEHGLLEAYKKLGERRKMEKMATRIAGRMVVGRALKYNPPLS